MIDGPAPSTDGTAGQKALAWLVHLFTASGVVLALLALDAVYRSHWYEALLWLFAALVVDAVDGSFARAAHVKTRVPRLDGDILDLVIDYLTYVLIPALFLWRAELVPPGLGLPLGALILLSSLYVFGRRDMKTDDGYFRGFPALWNIVALYLFVTGADPRIGAVVVTALALMSFAPIHFVHPFRVRDYGWALPALAILWSATTLPLLSPALDDEVRQLLLVLSLTSSAVLIALGLWRSIRGCR